MRSTSSWASRSWICRALPVRLARSMCQRNESCCAGNAVGAGAEVVEPGLAHDPDPAVGREPLDLGVRLVQPAAGGEPRHLVGVQRDPAEQRRHTVGGLDGEPGAGQVAPDLDEPVDPTAAPAPARPRGRRPGLVAVAGDVEVGVVVHDRDRQRVGRLGGRSPRRLGWCRRSPARLRLAPPAAGRAHSSTTDGSSLVKTGAGLLIGVPTTTGRDSHRGVGRVVAGDDRVGAPVVAVVEVGRPPRGAASARTRPRRRGPRGSGWRVREERRDHRVEVGDGLGQHVQHRPEPLALVVALELERLGRVT